MSAMEKDSTDKMLNSTVSSAYHLLEYGQRHKQYQYKQILLYQNQPTNPQYDE